MPITDYNTKKPLEVTSQNDSGTTQDKAQPLLLRGNNFTGIDGFESGSSQLGFESTSGITIDSNGFVYGDNSVKVSASNENVESILGLSQEINSDGKIFEFSINLQDQRTNDFALLVLKDSNSQQIVNLLFEGNGDIGYLNENNSRETIGTWSTNTVIDFQIIFDFTNNQFTIKKNGSALISDTPAAAGVSFSDITEEKIRCFADTSTSMVAYWDRLTYTAPVEDSVNTGGDIGVDFTNISDAQDIAVYDENGNLLDYEIESLDTAAETGVIWAYDNWVRDDSVQAQVAYGDNSANTDRQNVTGTWDNTGQNTSMIQHFEETTGNYLDSSSNDNDSSSIDVANRKADGQFGNAPDLDGTDDEIDFTNPSTNLSTGYTLVWWFQADKNDNTDRTLGSKFPQGSASEYYVRIHESTDSIKLDVPFVDNNVVDGTTTIQTDGRYYLCVITYDGNSTYNLYIDDVNEDTNTSGSAPVDTNKEVVVGRRAAGRFFDGRIDEHKIFLGSGADKTPEWVQAEFDASPKAGQVFFTQQAAEATVTDQTVTIPETQISSTNPDPQVNATVDVSIPTSTATTVNPEPTVSPGAAPLNLTATTASTANPDFTVQPGNTNVQTPVSTATLSNPDPQVNAFNDITVPETTASTVNPSPTLTVGQTIITPETTVTSTNPDLTVQPGETSLNISTTQISATNPEFGLNRQIVVGVATNLRSENPEPNLQPGAVSVKVRETSILTENPALQLQPGATSLQIQQATNLQTVNPEFSTVSGATELQVSETQLTASVQEPSIGLTLQFVSPTNALITNDERFFDMPDHTFTEGDLGDTLQATLKDDVSPDGVDLTGATEIKLVVKDRDGVKVFDEEMSLVDSSTGQVEYKWSQGDFIEEPGVYRAKIKVFDSSNEPESFPNDGFRTIEVEEEIS